MKIMKSIKLVAASLLVLIAANSLYALPSTGSCLSQLNTDTIDCDDHYSVGADGKATPFAHAGCILDATTAYYACVWNSAFN